MVRLVLSGAVLLVVSGEIAMFQCEVRWSNSRSFLLIGQVCLTLASGGIIDSIKNALGMGSSSGNSEIKVPANSVNLPNYFRLEAEIVRMDNSLGLKSNGGSCDTVGQCDPVVYAHLDV